MKSKKNASLADIHISEMWIISGAMHGEKLDAEYSNYSECVRSIITEMRIKMADLINRQKAIEAIKEYKYSDRFFKSYAIDILKEQPTAEITLDMVNDYCRPRCLSVVGNEVLEHYKPVRHGHWIDEGVYADNFPHHAWRCSKCGWHELEIEEPYGNYCRNCGAKMDEVSE